MLQFKQIIKSILKSKMLTGLNILNLVIAFTGIIILTLYVSFERSFDSFHENKDFVYRLDSPLYGSNLPLPIRKSIENKIPEIKDITTLWFNHSAISTEEFASQDITFEAYDIVTDSSFFNLFTYPLILGNTKGALSKPNTAVLTQSLANKLFGSANPIGKNILVTGKECRVVGVINDFPKNATFRADILTSFTTHLSWEPNKMDDWSEWSYHFFVKLNHGVQTEELAQKILEVEEIANFTKEMKTRFPNESLLKLTSLKQLHFTKDNEVYSFIDTRVLNVLTLLIVILAIMGSFNFINFSTSQAPLKAKTLSLFRILGGKRIASMSNVVYESIFLALLALGIALFIYFGINSSIQNLFEIEGLSMTGRYQYIILFIAFAVLFGIIASLYPSYYITSPALSQTVKGNAYFKNKGKGVRNSIILLQFVLTITLVASAFTIEKQLQFWNTYDIGLNKEQVIYFPLNQELREKHATLSNEISKLNGVVDYTYSQSIPGQVGMGWGRKVDGKYISLKSWPVDDKFLDFFEIKILEGRKFKKNSKADLNTFILNKKAVDQFEWEKPLEKTFTAIGAEGEVIGVAENFNFSSLKNEIQPLVL